MGTKHQTKTWRVAQRNRLRRHFEPAQRRKLELLRRYIERHGWDTFSTSITVRGVALGQWVADRRRDYRNEQLPTWLVDALEQIPGWEWEPQIARHQRALSALRAHIDRMGALPKQGELVVDGIDITAWMRGRRKTHQAKTIRPWLQAELDAIAAWTWRPRDSRRRFPRPPKRRRRQKRRVEKPKRQRQKRRVKKPKRQRYQRDPRALVAVMQTTLGKPAADIIDDIARLSSWIDSIGTETKARLPPAVHAAIGRESQRRRVNAK